MRQHKFDRVDKGIKRKAGRTAPDTPRQQDRQQDGTYLPVVTQQQRAVIIENALDRLSAGETTEQIARSHGIAGSTLRLWMLNNPVAEMARATYFSSELNDARQDIRSSTDPMSLARAREDFRAISWLAERRAPLTYGPKQQVDMSISGPVISFTIAQPEPKPQDVVFEQISEPIATIKTDAS